MIISSNGLEGLKIPSVHCSCASRSERKLFVNAILSKYCDQHSTRWHASITASVLCLPVLSASTVSTFKSYKKSSNKPVGAVSIEFPCISRNCSRGKQSSALTSTVLSLFDRKSKTCNAVTALKAPASILVMTLLLKSLQALKKEGTVFFFFSKVQRHAARGIETAGVCAQVCMCTCVRACAYACVRVARVRVLGCECATNLHLSNTK